MLPFHKRSRSSIEIGTDELEAIELPVVRPPSVRPRASGPRASTTERPLLRSYSYSGDDEMTVVRRSSPPPPRYPVSMPPIPRHVAPPHFDDDEPTTLLVSGSRPLLSMSSSRNVIVAADSRPPPPSREQVDEPPQSSPAVDASASGALRDLSMTSSLSGSTDIRRMRGPAWGVGLVAVGVFAGLVVAFVARGDGLAAAAALVDPSHGVTADVVSAVPVHQAPTVTAQGLSRPQSDREGAIVQPLPTKLAAPSCNADAVVPVAVAKVEAPTPHEPVVTYVAPVAPVAPRTIAVRHVEAPREPTQVAVVPPPVTKPIKVGRRAGNEVESASAADALAKAQLEAALSR